MSHGHRLFVVFILYYTLAVDPPTLTTPGCELNCIYKLEINIYLNSFAIQITFAATVQKVIDVGVHVKKYVIWKQTQCYYSQYNAYQINKSMLLLLYV